MQERVTQTHKEINSDLLRNIFWTPRWYWPLVGFLGLVFLTGAITFGFMMNKGLGHEEIECELDNWRVNEADWHLNEKAVDDVMKQLARRLVELKLAPRQENGQEEISENSNK